MGEDLVGRDAELASVARFLDAVPDGSTALLLEGEAGIGKTSLWRHGVALAHERSYRVLVCRPGESETHLSFAALSDLLEEVLGEVLPLLPRPQRRALEVALLLDEPAGPPPDQRAVSVAVLTALRAMASSRPVVLAVDDLQWVDAPSARALEFAMRRLKDEQVGLIGSRRAAAGGRGGFTVESTIAEDRLIRLDIGPLSLGALQHLLHSRSDTSLSRPTLLRLHRASGGNPFFALEIGRLLHQRSQESGSGQALRAPDSVQESDAAQPLPIPDTLQELVRERLAGLPDAARNVVLITFALSRPTTELVLAAAYPDTLGVSDAERAEVIEREGERIRLTHPLLGSVLYAQSPMRTRRALHERLASVVSDPEERARHLALSVDRPDGHVAGALEEAAGRARRRGALDAAADLAEQAAQLTPPGRGEDARCRILAACDYHFTAGDVQRTRALLQGVLAGSPPGPIRADALRRLAIVRYREESFAGADDVLNEALREAGEDPELRAQIHESLAWVRVAGGDPVNAAVHGRKALELAEGLQNPALLAAALTAVAGSAFMLGQGLLDEVMERALALEEWADELPVERRPRTMLGAMLAWANELESARGHLEAMYQRSVERGDESALPVLCLYLSQVECWAGRWPEAERHADAGLEEARRQGNQPLRAFVLFAKALVEAHLGREDSARGCAEEGLALAERTGSAMAAMLNLSALGFLELSLANPAQTHAYLGAVADRAQAVGVGEPGMLRFVPDELEALISLGELERAEALLKSFEERGRALGRRWALATSARCRGLLAAARGEAQGAIQALEQALDEHERLPMPFEVGRTMLVMGQIHRRNKQKRPAKQSLDKALRIFEDLGAVLWSAKA